MQAAGSFAATLLLCAAVFVGCTTKPQGVLSFKEMKSVTKDLMMAEAYFIRGSESDSVKLQSYYSILNRHKITPERYDSSLAWYGRNPNLLTDIYNDLTAELTEQKTVLDSLIQDSIEIRRVRMETVMDLVRDVAPRRLVIYPGGNYFTYRYELDNDALSEQDSLQISLRSFNLDDPNSRLLFTLMLRDMEGKQTKMVRDTVNHPTNPLSITLALPDSVESTGSSFLRLTVYSPSGKPFGHKILLDSIRIELPKVLKEPSIQPNDSIPTNIS